MASVDDTIADAAVLLLVLCITTTLCCNRPIKRNLYSLPDEVAVEQSDPRRALRQELLSDVIEGYRRDDPVDLDVPALQAAGQARIGVGLGDFLVNRELLRPPSRWPLVSDASPDVVSKLLRVHISNDGTAAWVSDEVSWRLAACGRKAAVPLRFTALFARDGERWVNVFEHLSYGHDIVATKPVSNGTTEATETALGRTVTSAVASRELSDIVSRVLAPLLAGRATTALDRNEDSILVGPRWSDEWSGAAMGTAPIASIALTTENRRLGVVGRDVTAATVAYWIGTVVGQVGDSKVRLRAPFVLERKGDNWNVVQGHVSVPVEDEELARRTFGTSYIGLNPLRVDCSH
jgi:hypothetical protein